MLVRSAGADEVGTTLRIPSAPATATATATPVEPVSTTPRVAFSVGGTVGGAALFATGDSGGYGIGIYTRVGAQVSEQLALDLSGKAFTLLLTGGARAAGTIEFSPIDWFAIGAGPSATALYASSFHGSTRSSTLYGLHGRIAFRPKKNMRGPSGARSAVELMLEVDGGFGRGSGRSDSFQPGLAIYFSVGFVRF